MFMFPLASWAQTAPWHQADFPPEEFRARWEKVFAQIGSDAVAVVQGYTQPAGFIFPRQSNEFYYLTGIETPHSYVLLDGRSHKVTLYMPPRNPQVESAEGKILSADDVEEVKQITGADDVQSTEKMREGWLGASFRDTPRVIYTMFSPAEGYAQSRGEVVSANRAIANDYWDGRISREDRFIGLLRARFARAEIRDLTPILDQLRSVKSPREVALIRKASQIAGLGMMEAIRSSQPGVYEYQLEAAARYVYIANGARLDAYRSIIGAGTEHIYNMHYYRNIGELVDGDMVLMDYAPDYHYYVSDIGRMWPINGKFAPWQRELLQFTLEFRNAVMTRIRPGVTSAQILKEAQAAMEPVFARTKFSKPIYEKAAHRLVETGGGVFSHPVGMAVHDDGRYNQGPLVPGHVFSIDPQLRVPEENLYIRYEDTVVVTENGVENFTDFLPSELDDIERLVKEEGLLQKVFPKVPSR
jgi:Xaa-Pro aminopeptidase